MARRAARLNVRLVVNSTAGSEIEELCSGAILASFTIDIARNNLLFFRTSETRKAYSTLNYETHFLCHSRPRFHEGKLQRESRFLRKTDGLDPRVKPENDKRKVFRNSKYSTTTMPKITIYGNSVHLSTKIGSPAVDSRFSLWLCYAFASRLSRYSSARSTETSG